MTSASSSQRVAVCDGKSEGLAILTFVQHLGKRRMLARAVGSIPAQATIVIY